MTDRIAGRLGGVKESHAPDGLKLHNLRKGIRTTVLPAAADVSGGITDWGMLGNDTYGDCGPAATEHLRMAKAVISVENGVPVYAKGFRPPHTAYTESLYFAYGRAQGEPGRKPDQGVGNITWLTWLYQQSKLNPGDDVVAFAEVDKSQGVDAIRQAMIDFHGCLVAVRLNQDAQAQFQNKVPWSVSSTDPVTMDGHDIALVAYGAAPAQVTEFSNLTNVQDWFVTWGDLQPATVDWDSDCIQDVWVFMTREDAERAGYDFDAAIAEIEKLPFAQVPVQGSPIADDLWHRIEDGIESVPEHISHFVKTLHKVGDLALERASVEEITRLIELALKDYTHGAL